MRYCTSCGQQAEPDTAFCTGCGARLPEPDPAPDPAPSAATSAIPQAPTAAAPYSRPPRDYPPAGRQGRTDGPRRLPRWVLAASAAAVLAIGGVSGALLAMRSPHTNHLTLSSHNGASFSPTAPSSPAGSGSAVSSPPPAQPASSQALSSPPEQVAAQDLATLLSQSAANRSAIVAAVNDVTACGTGLSSDIQTFQQAAASRQNLLSQLNNLPDSGSLPAQMLQDLGNAWQSSYQADQDFAAWAHDESANGCTPNDTSNSNYQAAAAPDDQATADKQAFVGEWNPIATQYSLTTYQWNQL